jgi:hypothetical protein
MRNDFKGLHLRHSAKPNINDIDMKKDLLIATNHIEMPTSPLLANSRYKNSGMIFESTNHQNSILKNQAGKEIDNKRLKR